MVINDSSDLAQPPLPFTIDDCTLETLQTALLALIVFTKVFS